ncbi:MAG: hypothetical protein EGQ98_04685 [Clostridium sp.]|nr:ABC transporter substrate-binding protein [Lacrimispora amygdalina]MBD9007655.1 hypothetical protein [Clostridium sp.]
MRKGYVYAMMAVIAAMTVSGCSSSSSAPASGAAETKTETAASADGGSAAADVTAAVDTIKFGLVAPLSGDNGAYGTKQEKGYELALEEINAAGGVLGAKLELETYDDGGDASTAANGAQKFADDDSIMAIGGSCLTSCTAAMLPITGDAEMAQLVVSSSAKSLTGISDYFFRMAVQDAAVGPQIANQFTKMGKTKAVTMYCNNDYGSGLKDSFNAQFEANGGQILNSIPYQATDQDFAAILTTVKSLDPDCIALCGTTTDGALIIKQARQMGIEAEIMGQPGLYSQNVIDIAGDASEGLLCSGVFVADGADEKGQEFVTKYGEKYNGEVPDGFAALAYDQMYVLADAAERAMEANDGELTRQTLAEALKETNYEGVTGTVNFDENGDWVRDYLTLTVKDGKYVLYAE